MATTYDLHLIATRPSHGDQHLDPVEPRKLGTYETEREAQDAGRALRSEAAKAGDLAQVRLCGQALEDVSSDNPACLDCANVLRGAS